MESHLKWCKSRALLAFYSFSKSSVAWSFASTGLRFGGFIIVLPFLVRTLSSVELGLWYAFLSMGALGGLIELGFAASGTRAAAYFWGGAPHLLKFGTPLNNKEERAPNFQGLADLVSTMRIYYAAVALLLLVIQGTIGSLWIQHLTEGHANLKHVLPAWLAYAAGISFNMSAALWPGLLVGIHRVALSQRIVFIAIAANYLVTVCLLFARAGIFAPVAGTILQAMITQRISHVAFRREAGGGLQQSAGRPSWKILQTLWPMSWRSAAIGLGAYLITQANTIVAASILGLEETASYGLSLQLVSALAGISAIWVTVKVPEFSSLRVAGNTQTLARTFIARIRLSLTTYMIGAALLITVGNQILHFIGAKTEILPRSLFGVMLCFYFLEMHHSQHAQVVLTENQNPFVIPAIASGICVVILSSILTPSLGVWGLLLSFGVTQIAFNNWWTVLRGLKGMNLRLADYTRLLLGCRNSYW